MKNILILIFTLWAMPSFAACPDDFLLNPPKQHEVIGCGVNNDGAHHFNIFDAAHQTISLRKQGASLNIQYKYTGDWLITPTRIQLVPFYLQQVRQYDGKLIFEDDRSATYKYYHHDKSHWLELSFVGDGIHMLKRISQDGIVLDAQYNVAQMKSRMKRYGKVIFYDLTANQASFANLVAFLKADKRKFYLVSHVFGLVDNEQKSDQQAVDLRAKLIEAGIEAQQIIAKGIGDVSPLKNPSSFNAVKMNTRVELVARP